MDPAPILAATLQIQLHLATALAAFVIGAVILLRPKGTRFHKTLGWTYVMLMIVVAGSAVFIRRPPGEGWSISGYTPIRLFVVLTAVSLPMAIYAIKRGDVRGHRSAMIGLYSGGLIIAGVLTFLPGRIMHRMFFG